MTSLVSPLTRKQVARILARKGEEGGVTGEILEEASDRLRYCRPADPSRRCRSPLCPDCLRLVFIAPIRDALVDAFGRFKPSSLRRVHVRVPGLVPGDYRLRRCKIQLREALQAFTSVGSPFQESVLSYAGLVVPRWRVREATHERGFAVSVQLLCRIDDEIPQRAVDTHWRHLLLRKGVTDLGPWASKKPLATVHSVRSVIGAIDLISRAKNPLPHNLAEIPGDGIVEAFGNVKERFRLYRRQPLTP